MQAISAAIASIKPDVIVYAASASKRGGSAKEIDFDGVANTARAAGKARLVLISALAVDRPDSDGYKMTNSMGGFVDNIMNYKLQGEEAVRKGAKDYAIVRPGVLMGGGKTKDSVELAQVRGRCGVGLEPADYFILLAPLNGIGRILILSQYEQISIHKATS